MSRELGKAVHGIAANGRCPVDGEWFPCGNYVQMVDWLEVEAEAADEATRVPYAAFLEAKRQYHRRSDPTGAAIGLGCAALGGAIVGGIVMWLLAWAVFTASAHPATSEGFRTLATAGGWSTTTSLVPGAPSAAPSGALLDTGAPLADGALASATSVVSTSAPSAAIGTALEAGTLKWADPSHGGDYLALRAPRGTWARICAVTCVRMRSTDVGPVGPKAIADIAVVVWEKVCGLPRSAGVCSGTVEVFDDGELPVLPATDTE